MSARPAERMTPLVRLVLTRLAQGMLTLFIVSVIVFAAVTLLPGDVADEILGQNRTPEAVAALRAALGLDLPPAARYLSWLGGVLRGDFGVSLTSGLPVAELIRGRIGNTAFLAAFAAALSVPASLALGMVAALLRGRTVDRAIAFGSLAAISMPEFFVAYALIFLFAVKLRWVPSLSRIDPEAGLAERLWRTLLPATVLTLAVSAHMIRMTRAAIVNLLASPYIEMARLKGAPALGVIFRHALPNALPPIINVVALNLAYLVVGVVVVEVVFVYPGLGQLLVDSVAKRDITVVQAVCMLFAGTYVTLNMLADMLSIATSPRLLHGS